MIESDTIKLLRECDAGIKMGVASIDDVLDYVHDKTFFKYLVNCKDEHDKLKEEIQEQSRRSKIFREVMRLLIEKNNNVDDDEIRKIVVKYR